MAEILARFIKRILKIISPIIFKILRWKIILNISKNSKGVLVLAPHTSNWDAFWGILYLSKYILPVPIRVAFKSEIVVSSFIGKLLRSLGGVPIDRKKFRSNHRINTIHILTEELKKLKEGFVIITPEGTRKATDHWKKGFYHLAQKSEVPLFLSKIDYKLKEIGIIEEFHISGDFEKDMKKINEFYKNISPKYPDKFKLHKI